MVRTGLSALLIIGTWATAGLTQAAAADPHSSAEPQASAGIVTAMQRDLGLTPAQASLRLINEAEAGTRAGRLRNALGNRFAGAWLRGTTSQELVVATTNATDVPAIKAKRFFVLPYAALVESPRNPAAIEAFARFLAAS